MVIFAQHGNWSRSNCAGLLRVSVWTYDPGESIQSSLPEHCLIEPVAATRFSTRVGHSATVTMLPVASGWSSSCRIKPSPGSARSEALLTVAGSRLTVSDQFRLSIGREVIDASRFFLATANLRRGEPKRFHRVSWQ